MENKGEGFEGVAADTVGIAAVEGGTLRNWADRSVGEVVEEVGHTGITNVAVIIKVFVFAIAGVPKLLGLGFKAGMEPLEVRKERAAMSSLRGDSWVVEGQVNNIIVSHNLAGLPFDLRSSKSLHCQIGWLPCRVFHPRICRRENTECTLSDLSDHSAALNWLTLTFNLIIKHPQVMEIRSRIAISLPCPSTSVSLLRR